MTATLNNQTGRSKRSEPSVEAKVAAELVRVAKEQGLSLTGPDGLLKQLTKTVLETVLNEEMAEHFGCAKHESDGAGSTKAAFSLSIERTFISLVATPPASLLLSRAADGDGPCLTLRMEVQIGDLRLPATLDVPVGPVRGGVVVLHAAEAGHRSYFCYDHLARLLPGHGIAVLRYDRRPRVDGHDVPLAAQADDAAAALGLLRRQVGDVPVGLWGVSQGAWAAALTAARQEVAFLVLVSGSGVSPAAQMRYGTAEQLRRHGFGAADLAELDQLRLTVERYLRGETGREPAQAAVDAVAGRPWFPLVYLPRELPAQPGTWRDMDFDPVPVFARVTCPVLAFFGETDGWVPIEESIAAWRRAAAGTGTGTEVTVSRLTGCDHLPTRDEGEDLASISPQYEETLLDWLDRRLARAAA